MAEQLSLFDDLVVEPDAYELPDQQPTAKSPTTGEDIEYLLWLSRWMLYQTTRMVNDRRW